MIISRAQQGICQPQVARKFASERLKNDVAFMIRAVRVSAYCLTIASDEMQSNRDVVLAAVKMRGGVLASASPELSAMTACPLAYVYAVAMPSWIAPPDTLFRVLMHPA